jgi:hypothetical protein
MKQQLARYYWWVRRHISAVAFATGFVWDTLTLTRIDLLYENVVFVTYLLVALVGIFLVHSVETRLFAPRWLLRVRIWLPALIQFPLGGLFSGFVIFFTKSASFFANWPFLLIIFTLFVGNEFFKKRYERLVFQVSLYYFALFSYFILLTPILLNTIGTATFVFAGILSLFAIGLILFSVRKLFPKLYKQGGRLMWGIVGAIFISYNVLYFTNTIPPVPLVLKEIGIYHNVARVDNVYTVTYESPAWYEGWRSTSKIFHRTKGEAVYCFSSVFLPTHFREVLYHSWQKKLDDGSWARSSGGRIAFTYVGGRDAGYRGYTLKQNLTEGEWRCVVETENKQVIGQVRFNILDVPEAVTLKVGTQ